MKKPEPGSYIDTQGMGGPMSPEEAKKARKQEYKPMMVRPRRLFDFQYVKEMKILINEVLDERAGRFNYISYFDTEKFKHYVGEDEPPYKPNTESYNPAYYQ